MINTKIIKGNFGALFAQLPYITLQTAVIITDEHVYALHQQKFEGIITIVIKPGEQHKQQATINDIVQQLIALEVDRNYFIIGVGGGVVTDIAGYVASVYMRGLQFGFVPTTILAMVDAAIGGKNGIDIGQYKNLVGTIKQPNFLLYDYSFLQTLPQAEWINGFAEIIKHACIKDEALFDWLSHQSLDFFQKNTAALATLIDQNIAIKSTIVIQDEFEKGDRKLLNFGHTLGHAIENVYQLPHGHAVSIGMVMACTISEEINNFSSAEKEKVIALLQKYYLPTTFNFDKDAIWHLLKMDKKRNSQSINFILLNTIGAAIIKPISLIQLQGLIQQNL
jgi:3-dehydroquinate synthase